MTMKNVFLLIVTTILLVSCSGKRVGGDPAAATSPADQVTADQAPAAQAPAAQAPAVSGRETYVFSTSYRVDENGQCDALILDCKSGGESQQFTFEFSWSKGREILEEEGSGTISEDDINADGYPDVVVCLGNFGVISPLVFYGACLWNEDAQRFDLVENYSDIPNAEPGFGSNKSTVASEWEAPDGASCVDYYDWVDGKLVLTRSDSK